MNASPEISVVIPTKDRWELVSRMALPAALGQEGLALEVVVVDDGSTDETPDRLATLADADPRVHVLRHERSQGVASARNAGLGAAQGAWVAFLDDDDIWSPRKLAAQLAACRRKGSVWAYARAVAVDGSGRSLYEYYFPDPSQVEQQLLESAVIPAGASNVVVRTDVVSRLGGFDERFFHLEDWDLWIRLASVGPPASVDEILVGVLFHPRNKHAVHDQSEELAFLIRKHASLDPPRVLDVDRFGHSRWVASQHSRAGMHGSAAWLYARDALRYRSPANLLRAADALSGKRLSSLVTRRGRETDPLVEAPDWLSGWSAFVRNQSR
jgi:glycosyltransferase involved in cell wall biosynthesis